MDLYFMFTSMHSLSLFLYISLNLSYISLIICSKFVIVQFGSYAFACHWLTLEQWAWCFLFGVGTLLWGQLVTTIPTHSLPKKLEVGHEVPDIANFSNVMGGDSGADTSELRKGQVLWLRGIARLQTQVKKLKHLSL